MSNTDTPKRGRGRPPLPTADRRKNLTIRVSDTERERMQADAKAAGMSLSAYLRDLCGLCLVLAMMGGCVPPGNWHDDGSVVLFDPEPFSTVERGLI